MFNAITLQGPIATHVHAVPPSIMKALSKLYSIIAIEGKSLVRFRLPLHIES